MAGGVSALIDQGATPGARTLGGRARASARDFRVVSISLRAERLGGDVLRKVGGQRIDDGWDLRRRAQVTLRCVSDGNEGILRAATGIAHELVQRSNAGLGVVVHAACRLPVLLLAGIGIPVLVAGVAAVGGGPRTSSTCRKSPAPAATLYWKSFQPFMIQNDRGMGRSLGVRNRVRTSSSAKFRYPPARMPGTVWVLRRSRRRARTHPCSAYSWLPVSYRPQGSTRDQWRRYPTLRARVTP